jgi:hypothetical protein
MSELGFNIEGLQKLLNVNENDSSDDDEKVFYIDNYQIIGKNQ